MHIKHCISLVLAGFIALVFSGLNVNAQTASGSESRQFTFTLAPGISREQARFKNRFGIELCADIYKPVAGSGKLPAIVVGGPYGAVKE